MEIGGEIGEEGEGMKGWRRIYVLARAWRRFGKRLREKSRDIAGSNRELAVFHLQRGNFEDALFRYRLVTWLRPDDADAWAGHGEAARRAGKASQARSSLARALAIQPQHEDARRSLVALNAPAAGE